MIKLIIKGFIIGIGKILPGVSGAMLAISLGVYEKAINSINNFFKNPIENFKFLISLLIGGIISIAFMSKVIIYLLNNYYLPTMLLFIGLIIGGIPNFIKKIDIKKAHLIDYIIMFMSFSLILFLEYFTKENILTYKENFFSYFFIGFIDAATMIIPGLCGTAIMILLGCYDLLLNLMASMANVHDIIININLLIPYALGIIVTFLIMSKLINYLFNNHTIITYFAILGFTFSSVLVLLFSTFKENYTIFQICLSLVLLVFGYIIGNKLDR